METIKCSHGPGISWRPILGRTLYVNPPHDPKRGKLVKKTGRQLAFLKNTSQANEIVLRRYIPHIVRKQVDTTKNEQCDIVQHKHGQL